jgi:hypothetical protein
MSLNLRMLRAALAYAEGFGFSVFPCKARGKTPLTEHGFKDATRATAQIRKWWAQWPNANVAIATGATSGIVVLDIDPRHAGDDALEALQAEHGKLPETPTVLTGGGGFHLYFRHPGAFVPNSGGRIGAGIDIRGDGGYVIAPKSVHESGNRYIWKSSRRTHEVAMAELPDWLLKLITSPDARGTPDAEGKKPWGYALVVAELTAGVQEGDRDNQLFRLACHLRRLGYSRAQAEPVLLEAATRCRPPFPGREALSKWRWR